MPGFFSTEGYSAFEALVENQDKYDDSTAIYIAKNLLANGMIPQFVYGDILSKKGKVIKVKNFNACLSSFLKTQQTKIDKLV